MFRTFWVLSHLLALPFCLSWNIDRYEPALSLILKGQDLDQEYDEDQAITFGQIFEPTEFTKTVKKQVETFDRSPAGETEFTTILFGYEEGAREMGAQPSHLIQTRGRCGGVLLTTNTVMTVCACLASYLNWMKTTQGQGPFVPLKGIQEHDILTKDIYVWYGDNVFKPWLHDFRIKLSNDPKKQIMNNGWCIEAFEKCVEKNAFCVRGNPALVRFDLPHNFLPQTLLPWPPASIVYANNSGMWNVGSPLGYKEYLKAYHYSWFLKSTDDNRLEYYDEFGNWLDIPLQLVYLNMTLVDQSKCFPDDSCLDPKLRHCDDKYNMRPTITCFQGHPDPELCEGLEGSPVYGANFELHGLAMKIYPCGKETGNKEKHSRMEVMSIDRKMADYIETLIPDLVDTSQEEWEPEHLAREQSDYKIYEMPKYKFEIVEVVPHSKTAIVTPFWFCNVLILALNYFKPEKRQPQAVSGRKAAGKVQELDREVRSAVRSWLRFLPGVPSAYIQAPVKSGGLGIVSLSACIPSLSSWEVARVAAGLDFVRQQLATELHHLLQNPVRLPSSLLPCMSQWMVKNSDSAPKALSHLNGWIGLWRALEPATTGTSMLSVWQHCQQRYGVQGVVVG
ncbi:hypothetical protein GE061_005691 [Apolygus lucorum]|uniref:Peptidase S1 domain-containing protein n=1 Tax=Apolygus lucorum TaxID=248454 RepID=A0A8S9WYD0_APOLU|nr:hypothetical protein GE061_005691 [Apolygus lucorum]